MEIGIIGCGNMGQALLRGMLAKKFVSKISIVCSDKNKKKLKIVHSRYGVYTVISNRELVQKSKIIILAVKPQDVDSVIQDIVSLTGGKLIISICAGVTTKRLEADLGKIAVIRVMPNIPARISQGISAICPGRYASLKDKKLTKSLFSCVGEVVEVKEQLLNGVTAISGSGPAYFFYLVERLIEAAKSMGIPKQIAQKLAVKTALGSAILLDKTKESPQVLRKKVTSKGGTTEAAYKVFKKKGLDKILGEGFKAAARRSKELEK